MSNNPFINQMNIQGTLYDLNDSRLQNYHDSIGGEDYIYTNTPFWFDEGAKFEGNTEFTADVTKGGDSLATEPWVEQQIASLAGALVLKGTVNSASDWNTIYAAAHKKGDTYLVTSAGRYAGQVCEPGDLIVCTTEYSAGAGANNKWTVVQNNLVGNIMQYENINTEQDLEGNMGPGKVFCVEHQEQDKNILGHSCSGGELFIFRDDPQTVSAVQDNDYIFIPTPEGASLLSTSQSHSSGDIVTFNGNGTGGWVSGKTLSAGTGLSLSTTSSTITFNHANSITAGAFGPTASSISLSFELPRVQYDAQGHISSVASFTHTIPTFAPATDSEPGTSGVLPAMSSMTAEQETWVLYANGTWGPQLGSGDEGYTLPLAADGTRGGLQIGYATDRTNGYFAVQLQSEKAYVAIPTFTGATSQADGAQGLVPQSFASASTTFLRADGEWANVAYVSSNILYM